MYLPFGNYNSSTFMTQFVASVLSVNSTLGTGLSMLKRDDTVAVDAVLSELDRLQVFGDTSNLENMIYGHIFGEWNKQRVTVYNGNII